MNDLKRDWTCERLLALARSEGLPSTRARRFGCPARCSDSGDTVAVSETTSGALWNCHRCGIGGSVIDLLQHTRGLDVAGALRELGPLSNVVPMRPPAPARETPDAAQLWETLALTDLAGVDYLRSRGLDGAPAVRFNIGNSGNRWLDQRAREGYRLALALFGVDGSIVSLQLRSVVVGVPAKDAKRSLAGVTYPKEGVAMGDVGWARTAERVYLAEGIADTLALQLAGVPVIGAPGVDQLKRLLNFLGDVDGREVVLCPQNDPHEKSQSAFASLAGKLADQGARVLELLTPAPHKDPADWLKAIGRAAFAAAVAQAPRSRERAREPDSDDGDRELAEVVQLDPGLPDIRITVQQHLVNDAAARALGRDDDLFQRAGLLVHVIRSPDKSKTTGLQRPPAAPHIKPLPLAVLRERLTAVASWSKFNKTEHAWMPAHPPDWSVAALHARGTWMVVRPIAGVVEVPVLRPDGSVLDEPGYDDSTELLFEPSAEYLPVPEQPTLAEAKAAMAELLEIVADFPFERPEHQSAWVAALLTPFARHAFSGPTPLTLIDANSRGAGKSLLADLISLVFCGRPMARMSFTDDDAEMAKRVMSIALAGDPLVLFDNVEGLLGGQTLNKTLTAETVRDRLLNTNDAPEVPITTQWLATGNNVLLFPDTTRRTLHVRLATQLEKPEEREGFQHADIRAWVRAERLRLVRAALTVLRAYTAAGSPDQNLKPWGSFEGWSRMIRHALVWVGLPDPGLTREELTSGADTDAELADQLVVGWNQLDVMGGGYTVREALKRVEEEPRDLADLKEALDALCSGKPPTVRMVSNRLKRFRDRVVGGKQLHMENDRDHFARWSVRKVEVRTLRTLADSSQTQRVENFFSKNPGDA